MYCERVEEGKIRYDRMYDNELAGKGFKQLFITGKHWTHLVQDGDKWQDLNKTRGLF
jgi:hypothetical protein